MLAVGMQWHILRSHNAMTTGITADNIVGGTKIPQRQKPQKRNGQAPTQKRGQLWLAINAGVIRHKRGSKDRNSKYGETNMQIKGVRKINFLPDTRSIR